MLQCPKQLHKIYKFQRGGRLFIADLERCQAIEIDDLTWQILERCATSTSDSIIEELGRYYPKEEIQSVLERLAELEEAGLLFRSEAEFEIIRSSKRPRYLCPNPRTFLPDIRHAAGGHPIALHYLIKALGAFYADVDICHSKSETLAKGIYRVPFYTGEPAFFSHLLRGDYQGIFLSSSEDTFMIPFLRFLPIPVVVPLYTLRGHSGDLMNRVFLWYSALRNCDAFVVPTNSVKSFYTQYL